MNEIAPGIYHWTAEHPDIHLPVSSYYVEPAGIVTDPLEPEEGTAFFDELEVPPQQVVLTIGLHWRHSDRFAERYGATIRACPAAIARWGESSERSAEPFEFGDEVAPGVVAVGTNSISPDDTTFHIAHGGGALAFGDGLVRPPVAGSLGYVPDFLMDEPEKTKQGLTDAYRGLLERDFEHLLFAHGEPLIGGGHSALSDFVAKPVGFPDFGSMA
jgi:hypothetical protein